MQSGKKLIFMVDDDKVILNLLEYIFQGKNGYQVKTFLSGEACVECMDMNPDLVVLDYILNVNDKKAMNGLETMKMLLKINKDLPVIILSAFTDAHTGEDMMKNGALAVLRKDDYFVDKLEKYIVNSLG
jgi:two-component system, OmpR family, response regulator